MVWYERPGLEKFTSKWKHHIVTEGPDIIFKGIPYHSGFETFCTEFWNEKLTAKFVTKRFLNALGKNGYGLDKDDYCNPACSFIN